MFSASAEAMQETAARKTGLLQRIFRTNRRLKRDPKNPYARERLRIHEIRREIEGISDRIEEMHRLKERLRERQSLRSMSANKQSPKPTKAQPKNLEHKKTKNTKVSKQTATRKKDRPAKKERNTKAGILRKD